MSSKSAEQAKLMRAVKHNPKFAKKVGIPQSVGEDYVAADKRAGRYAAGGSVLGALGNAAGRVMRPIRPVDGMLRSADRVMEQSRMKLLKFKGGRAKGG